MGEAVRLYGIGIIIPLPLGLFPVFSCLSLTVACVIGVSKCLFVIWAGQPCAII